MKSKLKYNWENMLIDRKQIESMKIPEINPSKATFSKLLNAPLSPIKRHADIIRSDFKHYVIVGIGGSDLGSRTIYEGLRHLSDNEIKISFIGANTDPLEINEFFQTINFDETIFAVISKSGETIEIISNFLHIRKLLKDKYNAAYSRHILAITNPDKGTLRDICRKDEILMIYGPEDVGDRFSVLSVIGMLTAELMGLDSKKFIDGAKSVKPLEAFEFASISYISYLHNKNISVVMPYATELKQFGFWFRQLWAESLGKDGKGITPVAALGSTDQHSQIQLYVQGPSDKIITFIEIANFPSNISISIDGLDEIDGVNYLKNKTMQDIIHIEKKATADSLTENSVANGTIVLDKLDEYNLGALFYFFEMSCTMIGDFMKIDPFNQPGVEKGKEYMYRYLGRKGYEI